MSGLVSVVVVTCGKNNYHCICLESIARQTYRDLEVILIDNSFDSVLPEQSRRAYPSVKVFTSAHNLYYCDSMNKGIFHSAGAYVLCLNDDVTLAPAFIEEAMKGFKKFPRVGMVSGKILRQDGRTMDSAGLFLTTWRTAQERGYGLPDQGQFDKEEKIFGVCGAAAFYRREMLDDIRLNDGWFDPAYHIFYEDLDVSWRAQRKGWLAYYMPSAMCFHVRGGSVRQGKGGGKFFARRHLSDERQVDLFKNRYLTILRNETVFSFLLCLVPMLLYEIGAWSYVLFFKPQLAAKIVVGLQQALRSRRLSSPSPEVKA